jgi:tol-pal system protein YbgF
MKTGLRSTLFSLALLATASMAVGQDNTRNLADIRSELGFLSSQIQGLRSELAETGAAQSTTSSGPALMRVDAIENELRVLTGQVEELQFRIEKIAKDATNRVGDLEFRLTELEGGDAATIGATRPVGGEATSVSNDVPDGVELTVIEKSDYEAALATLNAQDFELAAQQFDTFIATFPGGPLTSGAQFHKGEALEGLGDWKSAGRSYLDSFSSAPAGKTAPQALYKLGVSLSKLQKTEQACQTLSEVETRFPADAMVAPANQEMQSLGCS